ncbi:MAG: hypothetical protein GF368_00145 [Candidatus Aenigmarchaeota archaeon]|nr:hypothetical protein [Candidatus Aenigmarchaeota archaeon]
MDFLYRDYGDENQPDRGTLVVRVRKKDSPQKGYTTFDRRGDILSVRTVFAPNYASSRPLRTLGIPKGTVEEVLPPGYIIIDQLT